METNARKHRLCSYLHFCSGSEGNVACSIAILALLLCSLRPYEGREGRGQVASEQSFLWRNI